MAEEKKSLFRKESLDRISSPEEYDQYLKVTGPGVWVVLAAVVLLLVGALVWAVFGKLDTTMDAVVVSDGRSVVCVYPAEYKDSVNKGSMKIVVAEKEYDLVEAGLADQILSSQSDYADLVYCGYPEGLVVSFLKVDASLEEGLYAGKIQVEKVSPIYFILN